MQEFVSFKELNRPGRHTAIFKMDNQQGPIVQDMEDCSVLCGSLDEKNVWGRIHTCICMAEQDFPGGSTSTEPACPCRRGKRWSFNSLVGENPLKKEMATYSRTLAWEIPWTAEPDGLQSMRSQSI